MERLIEQYRYHDMLYHNVLDGIRPEHMHIRINGLTNHIAWIAGNLPATRCKIAESLGVGLQQAFPEFYEDNKAIMPDTEYPSLDELIKDWERITPVLEKRLGDLTQEELMSESPFHTPKIAHDNLLGTIAFLIDREAYAIGQLSLMRKAFGYEAMKYSYQR